MDQSSTIQKATDVLFFLKSQTVPLGVSQIAQNMGLPKTSAHRLLQSLKYRALVAQDERGRYCLGEGLIALTFGAPNNEALIGAAQPIMASAARELEETFFLVAAHDGRLAVLDKAEGPGLLRVAPQVGSAVPIHATAVGHLYLAHAPEQVALPAVLERYTTATPNATELKRVVARCQQDGVALSYEEWKEGLSAIAAPIIVAGQLLAVIVAALISPRLKEVGEQRVITTVVRASRQLISRLEGNQ